MIPAQLLEIITKSDINNLSPHLIQDSAVSIYQKNKNGKYLIANSYMAHIAGLNKESNMYGLTDFDFSWSAAASQMVANDQKVMLQKKATFFIEECTTFDGLKLSKASYLSYKTPLKTQKGKVSGITAFSFRLMQSNDGIEKSIAISVYLNRNS